MPARPYLVALNSFDTLLFCGAILLLANATEKETGLVSDSGEMCRPYGTREAN